MVPYLTRPLSKAKEEVEGGEVTPVNATALPKATEKKPRKAPLDDDPLMAERIYLLPNVFISQPSELIISIHTHPPIRFLFFSSTCIFYSLLELVLPYIFPSKITRSLLLQLPLCFTCCIIRTISWRQPFSSCHRNGYSAQLYGVSDCSA